MQTKCPKELPINLPTKLEGMCTSIDEVNFKLIPKRNIGRVTKRTTEKIRELLENILKSLLQNISQEISNLLPNFKFLENKQKIEMFEENLKITSEGVAEEILKKQQKK